MENFNVAKFANELGIPIEQLMEQLQSAGVAKQHESDSVSEQDKAQRLEHMRIKSGSSSPQKIIQTSLETTDIRRLDSSGELCTTQVRVRKRRWVTPIAAPVAPSFTAKTIKHQTYVIDGMNICGRYGKTHPKEASIQPLLTVLIALLDCGYDFYCVCNASITDTLDEKGKAADVSSLNNILNDYPEKFCRVTGDERTDDVILQKADLENWSIITNGNAYQNYKDRYSWLNDKNTERLINVNLSSSGLLILGKSSSDKFSMRTDTELALRRIRELIDIRNNPEISALDKQLQQRRQSSDEINKRCEQSEAEHQQLKTQIGNLNEGIVNLIAERDALRTEIIDLNAKENEMHASLEELVGVRDFDAIKMERTKKLNKLISDIALLETIYTEKKQDCEKLGQEAQQYQVILDQKSKADADEKLKLRDELVCIMKAQAAISDFLAKHQDLQRRGYLIEIPFEGFSWDEAKKGLEIFFVQNKICNYCFECHDTWRDMCYACHNGKMIDVPKELWDRVLKCAPSPPPL